MEYSSSVFHWVIDWATDLAQFKTVLIEESADLVFGKKVSSSEKMSRRKQARPIRHLDDEENPLGAGPIPTDEDHQASSSSIGEWHHHPIAKTQFPPSFAPGLGTARVPSLVNRQAAAGKRGVSSSSSFPLSIWWWWQMNIMTQKRRKNCNQMFIDRRCCCFLKKEEDRNT